MAPLTTRKENMEAYLHEAMDRVHIVQTIIDNHLRDHPGIVRAGANQQIDDILSELANIYQAIGRVPEEEWR